MKILDGKAFLARLNRTLDWAERRGWLQPMPAFLEDYSDYPAFRKLEDAWPDIHEECTRLMERRSGITDISTLGGNYTAAGIHTIDWKSFVLFAGEPLESNCAICPKTAAALADIPDIYLAFFSILEPHQYVKPHWGYYKGLLRYHLGVIIPDDNREELCWLRINESPQDNALRDKALIEHGKRYYWHNGKGVFFDDTKLHDAANGSDAVRVVLWIDVRRRFPWWFDWINRTCLRLALRTAFLDKLRKRSSLDPASFAAAQSDDPDIDALADQT